LHQRRQSDVDSNLSLSKTIEIQALLFVFGWRKSVHTI